MTTSINPTWRIGLGALAWLAASAMGATVRAEPQRVDDGAVTLYRSFTMSTSGDWTRVVIHLGDASWRSGTVDGAPASAAQVAALRGSVATIVVGGRCRGAFSGRTYYACAFQLAPGAEAAAATNDAAIDALAAWSSTSNELLTRFEIGAVSASSLPVAVTLSPSLSELLPGADFLGLYRPAAPGFADAISRGVPLEMRFRAVPNPVTDVPFENEGVIVLTTRRIDAAPRPVPRPARANHLAV